MDLTTRCVRLYLGIDPGHWCGEEFKASGSILHPFRKTTFPIWPHVTQCPFSCLRHRKWLVFGCSFSRLGRQRSWRRLWKTNQLKLTLLKIIPCVEIMNLSSVALLHHLVQSTKDSLSPFQIWRIEVWGFCLLSKTSSLTLSPVRLRAQLWLNWLCSGIRIS